MRALVRVCVSSLFLLVPAALCFSQVEGIRPSTGTPMSRERMVYGRVIVDGLEPGAKLPSITVTFLSQRLQATRTTLDNEGFYYFRELTVSGGMVVVEVNGSEAARQTLLTGPLQQRLDFHVKVPASDTLAKPGTLDARYAYERTKENRDLFEKAVQFIEKDRSEKAIPLLKRLVAGDPGDYAAWTILGAAYMASADLEKAESAYRSALDVRADSVPTMTSLGRLYIRSKKYEPAIELLEKAVAGDAHSALAFRLLGEAYLMVRKGSKGITALTESLRLAPVEMADAHLLLARLYDVAGARHLASLEYKLYLEKVADHPDKDKMRDYIRKYPIEEIQ